MALQESLHESVATRRVSDVPNPNTGVAGGSLAAIGAITGLGAIAASSCCVVPLILASVGAGAGIFGILEFLAPWRIPLLIVSGAGVAAGWFAWWRNRRIACEVSACAPHSRSQAPLILLVLASLVIMAAVGWNYLEPSLLKLARST